MHARALRNDRHLFVGAGKSFERNVLLLQGALFPDFLDLEQKLVKVEGLCDVVVGSFFHGLDHGTDAAEAGDDDHLHIGLPLLDLVKKLHTAQPGHPDVGDQQVEVIALELLKRIQTALRTDCRIALLLEGVGQVFEGNFLVFGYQYLKCHIFRTCPGQTATSRKKPGSGVDEAR